MTVEELKEAVGKAALDYVDENTVVGVGTGTTVRYFIEALATIKHRIAGTVASSIATETQLKNLKIPVFELNTVDKVSVYVDGADTFNPQRQLVKGGGGALTREKILSYAADQFVCIVDESKRANVLGKFPIPIEVIPMARSYVAREIIKLGGQPVYRENVITDNGNQILDVHNWEITDPIKLERALNNIAGVVCNGIFAEKPADIILIATETGMSVLGASQALLNKLNY